VLTRALCRYNRFDLSRLPAAKRRAALALQLPQWSPFSDSNYAIVWHEGVASVWCWDNGRVNAEILKHAKTAKSHQIIPETLLRSPLQGGMRLVKCMDGVEGQYWLDSQLIASRWWPERPDESAWLSFQRDCGVPPEQQISATALQELPLQRYSWAKFSNLIGSQDEIPLVEVMAYSALVLALGLPTLYLNVEHYQIKRAISSRADELASIKRQASAVFTAREAALEIATRVKSIESIERFPQSLVLMAAVANALPKDSGAFVREWEMTDDRLKILVSSPNSNIIGATYVQALEKAGRFNGIQIITNADPKLMTFSMTILPVAPQEKKTDGTSKSAAI